MHLNNLKGRLASHTSAHDLLYSLAAHGLIEMASQGHPRYSPDPQTPFLSILHLAKMPFLSFVLMHTYTLAHTQTPSRHRLRATTKPSVHTKNAPCARPQMTHQTFLISLSLSLSLRPQSLCGCVITEVNMFQLRGSPMSPPDKCCVFNRSKNK